MVDVNKSLDAVFGLYKRHGTKDYIGEPVSQTEHMIQCAMLAEKEGYETLYVLAALFHDIGHLVAYDKGNMSQMIGKDCADAESNLGAMEHGRLGATFLKSLGFPEDLCEAVAAHVDAKRYLVHADATYHDKLSSASKQTLIYQGGPMNAQEANEFRQKAFFDAVIRLRFWDDLAKETDFECKPLEYYEGMCRQYLLAL